MSIENGFQIIDNALSLALTSLAEQGLPKDEAQIALLLRLKHVVPSEIQKVAELLSDDDELNERINPNFDSGPRISAEV